MTSRTSAMLGSAMAETIFWRSDFSYSSMTAPAVCSVWLLPSKRVTTRPSRAARIARSLGATRSARCWSSASRSVNDLLSRTAVSASMLFRPRLEHMLRRYAAASFSNFCFITASIGSHHNGMRRARVCSRRHGGDVTRFQQKKSGRRRAPAARGHVSDHGNRGSDDFLDSLAHGINQSARSIQPYENQRSVFLFGLGDRAADNLGGDGVHHAIHVDRDYFRGRRNGLRPKRQRYGEKAASDIANYHGSSQSNTIYTTQTTWSETMHNGSETYCS